MCADYRIIEPLHFRAEKNLESRALKSGTPRIEMTGGFKMTGCQGSVQHHTVGRQQQERVQAVFKHITTRRRRVFCKEHNC